MSLLHQQATIFIKNSPFFKELKTLGEVVFTGSYALDTMTWPDIDVQLKVSEHTNPFLALSHLTSHLLQDPQTVQFQFVNFKDYPRSTLPKGFCVGVKINDPTLETSWKTSCWKIDFWILEQEDFEQNRVFMARLQKHMAPAHKDMIMTYKERWTKEFGRPPQLASYYLYQAIVFEGLTTEASILEYLRKHHVKI